MSPTNQISWRHHYIPQFYLKGFTSANGKFKIYDVQKGRFVKNGKDFSTESFFFEKDGNTVCRDEEKSDFIEDFYLRMDNDTAEVFNRINKSNPQEKFNIDENDIALLQYFVGIMYWRIPRNYGEIANIINRKRLKELGLIIKSKNGEIIDDKDFEQKLKSDNNFFKAMKFWFPSISYPEIFDCDTPLHIFNLPEGLPSLCSDNPIICRNPEFFRVYTDDFILPLTSTKLFIRGDKIQDFMSTLKVEIDLLTYKQSIKFVSCTDERYIQELDKIYEKNKINLKDLRFSIFRKILNYCN